MRHFLGILFFLGLSFATRAGETANLTGSWANAANAFGVFSLNLTQTGNRLQGYHGAIALRGKRIDAVLPSEGPPSIIGTISGNVAHVRFRSGYDEHGHGEATLTLRDHQLVWEITKSTGTHYLPTSAVLSRQKTPRAESSKHAS